MISGNKVKIKAIEKEDLEQLMEWRNLPEFRKYFREYRDINENMQNKWFENTVVNDKNTIMFSIFDNCTKKLIGCCGLCYINWVHRYADLSLYIGIDECYIDDCGYAEEACKLLFDYGFNELNLNKIWTEIYEFDHKKKALYDKLGFNQDGLLRQNYFYEGRWWASRIISLLSSEFNTH
ncbi:GNAT family N-acetyltransferase [Sedimentibacter sp. zth1]|uniref:GNAT family N-acetyltransferase n=1 Tax=Sedimentibacter sp. zth1 TaxID=2816908 RepID=UPI001A932AF6|nr:GNAT family protein [Sedimentibacter sp. zth1]QSX07145.1 GNAT family N-acetyltransferase [Sedimentibacter sp. zth1]